MTEAINFKYSMKELTETLIKKEGLTDGKWMLAVEFGIRATNIGPDNNNLSPAAVIPIISIGLMKTVDDNNLTVDAATINIEETELD